MSTTAIQPGLPGKSRSRVVTKPATDFYGGVGWIIGLLITVFVSTPVILLLVRNAPHPVCPSKNRAIMQKEIYLKLLIRSSFCCD